MRSMSDMLAPSHINRNAEEIIRQNSYLDSAGYLYRAVSWLDYFERIDHFPALLYACIEGRFGIEYLLFEELVIGTGTNLSRQDYEKCLKEPTKLKKAIDRLIPDYEKLQQFTSIVVILEARVPKLIYWEPRELMKSWVSCPNTFTGLVQRAKRRGRLLAYTSLYRSKTDIKSDLGKNLFWTERFHASEQYDSRNS